jgi:hypothetical protein
MSGRTRAFPTTESPIRVALCIEWPLTSDRLRAAAGVFSDSSGRGNFPRQYRDQPRIHRVLRKCLGGIRANLLVCGQTVA